MNRLAGSMASAILLLLSTGPMWAGSELQSNEQYAVAARTSQSLEIRDLPARSEWVFTEQHGIQDWELIPAGRLLAYVRGSSDGSESCLLDLSTRVHLCSPAFSREPGEPPWSPAGKFFVWKTPDWTQLRIAAAGAIHISKEGHLPPAGLIVQGHPLGLIWQESWLSETQLLVATGVGEGLSLGVLDLEQKQFFYLVGTDERASIPREIQESKLDIVGWLSREGFLSNRARWKKVQPDVFPWTQAY